MRKLHTIKINNEFSIAEFSRGGWILKYFTKKPPKITHHATIQQLCRWVINKHAGNAKDFETLLDALNRASDNLESEFTITVENLK